MKTFRASILGLLLAAVSLALSGCYVPSNPPPPRVRVAYEPPVYQPPKVAVQLVTSETGLTNEQIESRREDALRYVRDQGYLRENEVIVDDATVADRVLYVSQRPEGGYDVRVFTPSEHGSFSSSSILDDDYWSGPRGSSSIIVSPRPYYRFGYRDYPFGFGYPFGYGAYPFGFSDPLFFDPYDPFYPRASFFYRRDYLRPYSPRFYGPPVHRPFPRHAPNYRPRGEINPPPPSPDPRRQEPLLPPRRVQP